MNMTSDGEPLKKGFLPSVPFFTEERRKRYPGSLITWFVPETVEKGTPCGLLIFLHGGGRTSTQDQPWKSYFGPGTQLQPYALKSPYVLAAPAALPSADGKRWNHPEAVKYVLDVLEEACTMFPVDRNRVILGGHSMGGFGAYHLSQILADRFAGVLMSSGGWWESDFRNLKNTPVFLLHGLNDTSPDFKGTLPEARHHDWCGFSFAEAAHFLMERDNIAHEFHIHDGGHSYSCPLAQLGLEAFSQWFPKQVRNTDPEEVYVSTPAGTCDPLMVDHFSSYWLEIVEQATGDLDYDRIVLSGPNVAQTQADLALQKWSVIQVPRSGCSLHAFRTGNNAYLVATKNIAVYRIWLQGELPENIFVESDGFRMTVPITPCRRELDPEIVYTGYGEVSTGL